MSRTIIGFTISCSSRTSPGLDGDEPVYVGLSIWWPGMKKVYESVTKLDAKSKGAQKGEDTGDVATKIAADLSAAFKSGALPAARKGSIKVQTDGGGPGNTRARIIIKGAHHVNFAVIGDAGKIRWHALGDAPTLAEQTTPAGKLRKRPPRVIGLPVQVGGSGAAAVGGVRVPRPMVPFLVQPGRPVPTPRARGFPKSQKNEFLNGWTQAKKGETGIYGNEKHTWKDIKL